MMLRALHIAIVVCMMSGCMMQGSHDANTWINGLEKGMSKDEIEGSKPEHVSIHWDHPITDSLKTEYDVTYEDRKDFAHTPYFLVFRNGKYDSYSGRN